MKTRLFYALCALFLLSLPVLAAVPAPAPGRDDTAATASNAFAASLYGQLGAKKDANIFFSPLNIMAALSMTYAGASTATAEEMAKAMHIKEAPDKWHTGMGALLQDLNAGGMEGTYKLSTANALWIEKTLTLQTGFTEGVTKNYGAGIEAADFKGAPEAAREAVNDWALKQTSGKITDLMPKGSVDELTRLVLASAIYFDGKWLTPFEPKDTKKQAFASPGGSREAPLMYHEFKGCDAKYREDDGLQILWLPYRGQRLSMLVLLPRDPDDLAKAEEQLPEKLDGWITGAFSCPEVHVTLPKFKLAYDAGLIPPLQAMGMRQAFSPGLADFTGITGTKELFITAAIHKAVVEVDEQGTVAAAATGIALSLKSAPAEPVDFRADHPFIFLIRDDKTGAILFMGRVTDPA